MNSAGGGGGVVPPTNPPPRGRGREQRDEVHVALEVRDLGEALLERDREQEGEQHLHARHRDTQLVEELVELAIEPLVLGLLALGRVHAGHPLSSCPADSPCEREANEPPRRAERPPPPAAARSPGG
jgi:hypothetical protein